MLVAPHSKKISPTHNCERCHKTHCKNEPTPPRRLVQKRKFTSITHAFSAMQQLAVEVEKKTQGASDKSDGKNSQEVKSTTAR